ncbi:MAG: DUF2126 domain-containing protein, partial [Pirellulales bacterium]
MSIRVALNHRTSYDYDQLVTLFPQVVRLRPAPHSRTPIVSYSLEIEPQDHFLNWQLDPHGNYQARLVFPNPARRLSINVNLVAEMTVINPFDFFLESYAEEFPFSYEPSLATELVPFLAVRPQGPLFDEFVASIDRTKRRTIDFLVGLNQRLQGDISYLIRMEPGVQTPEQTLEKRSGSCRDTAWLMVQALRSMGLAARFVSGYLIQLRADVKPLEGPAGPDRDFTDLHAWIEVYLPGAGWVGLDPTSGLFAGEGHIPLACTPEPASAAPITGSVAPSKVDFGFSMSVARVHEDPRVTLPYTDRQWTAIESLGHRIDSDLERSGVRLTMGAEPTFVSVDDMDGAEWNFDALGPTKRLLAGELIQRLRGKFAPGGCLQYGQGKHYPGEQVPRWALSCHWRRDGVPIWEDASLIGDERQDYGHNHQHARRFAAALAENLGLSAERIIPGYEDCWHFIQRERHLPINVNPLDSQLEDPLERARLARVFERGLRSVVGFALPLSRKWTPAGDTWISSPWTFRQECMFLIPGDSPMGLRLPLDSLPWQNKADRRASALVEVDPLAERGELPQRQPRQLRMPQTAEHAGNGHAASRRPQLARAQIGDGAGGFGQLPSDGPDSDPLYQYDPMQPSANAPYHVPAEGESAQDLVRTALCVEAREGRLHVFLPPLGSAEDYLQLVEQIELTAKQLQLPVILEGYPPPRDHRLNHLSVTPDPGVIEVNIQPSHNWDELVRNTTTLYDEAHKCRLGTEKFMIDGRHSGTGGGNHIVLGGSTPADSPFLRRPDLLRSLLAYWNNHPALSYLFSGTFIGPTSQAPRVDEARHEALHELEIAFGQIPEGGTCPPWLVDRAFRHLLTDLTGNTHRAEFCIDKLYSPDSSSGRLGLVELRGFEMPPHARMSLTQQLMLRAMVSWFWKQPYRQKLVCWGTALHDRFMLPHFVWQDLCDVTGELQKAGYPMPAEWFNAHYEFRFPRYGQVAYDSVNLELRAAIEPWHVLGEETVSSGTSRYVDSSLERVQVKLTGMIDNRHVLLCNGRRVPLHPTGTVGEFVAGVRFRAWQPPSCLHPNIGVHAPLTFDLLDTWNERSIGGCRWHVSHPGGMNYEDFPVNANAA